MREAQSVMSIGSTFVERGEFGKALRWYRRAAASASKRGMAMLEPQLRRATALTLLQLDGRQRRCRRCNARLSSTQS